MTNDKMRRTRKKTRQGKSDNTRWGHKGGGKNGSTPSNGRRRRKKRYRGQGR